jgi:hypothetical protein
MDQMLIDELVGRHCCRIQSVADNANCCTYAVTVAGRTELEGAPAGMRQEIMLAA